MSRRSIWRFGAGLFGAGALSALFGRAPAAAEPGTTGTSTAGPGAAVPVAGRDIPLRGGWRCTGTRGRVTVPHIVARQSWRRWNPASWERISRYDTTFDLPYPAGGCRYLLRFAGVLTAATPTVNGRALPRHDGGYLPFEYEITGLVRDRGNQLSVRVDGRFTVNVPPDRPLEPSDHVDYWQPAGIYREVVLRAVPNAYLADVHATPRAVLDPAARACDVAVTVDSAVPLAGASVRVRLLDGTREIAAATAPVPDGAAGVRTAAATLTGLAAVRLWDLDDPRRYQVEAALLVSGATVHEYRVTTGFRAAEFTTNGFFLNGTRRTLIGLNRHQFFPYVGGAMPPRVQHRDARILRDLNCSMVRCSHYPQSEAFLDACDELGILVFSEVPGWQFIGDAAWQEYVVRDVHDMIVRDRNHPSVVAWGVRLNETPGDAALYTRTQQLARELDPSRQTTGAIIGPDYATTDFQQDVFSYNDYDNVVTDGLRLPRLRAPRTDLPYLVTEAVGTLSGPGVYYRRTEPMSVQHGQALAHALVHEQAAADPRYCGVLGWSGFDYPSGTGNQFEGVKYTGVVDEFRVPKLGAAMYRAQVDPARRVVIEPAFYWDLTDRFAVTALGAEALIFANADRLVLTVDGHRLAELTPDRARFGHLPYPPFVADFSAVPRTATDLRIDAYRGQVPLGSRTLCADRRADRLSLVADDHRIAADGVDATRLVVRLVDRYGAPAPPHPGSVRLTLAGPGELIGDNPFPLGDTGGVTAFWVRGHAPGVLQVTAVHDTLGTASTQLALAPPEDTEAP